MTDMPERIWADQDNLTWVEADPAERMKDCEVEFVRADMTPSLDALAEALRLPQIKALVDAADYILDGMGIDYPDYTIDPDDDFLDAANSKWVTDTLSRLAAALAALAALTEGR